MSKAQKIVLWDDEVRETVHRLLDGLNLAKPWQVVIKPFYESPSDRQRGYYWTTVLPSLCRHVEACGQGLFSHDEMHEWLKRKFGQAVLVEINGEAYEVTPFTTSNKGEIAAMTAYLTRVLEWAAGDLGLYIPPPRDWSSRGGVSA